MNLNVTGPFIYFTIPIFGGIPITQTTISSLIITIALIIVALKLARVLKSVPTASRFWWKRVSP